MTEQEHNESPIKALLKEWAVGNVRHIDAFKKAYDLGRNAGLEEAAEVPSMMPYVFAVGADIRELEGAILALKTAVEGGE